MDERRASLVVLCDTGREAAVGALCASLQLTGRFQVERTSSLDRLLALEGVAAVYADWPDASLSSAHDAALRAFVEAGGRLVLAGGTLAAWSRSPGVASLAGWSPDGRTRETELRLTLAGAPAHGFRVREQVHLLAEAPGDAEVLLQARWRHSDQVVAYSRRCGAGAFVYLGLGHSPETYASSQFRGLVLRLLAAAANTAPSTPFGVGLIGFGALGPAHAAAIESVPGLRLRALCDRAPARREAAAALQVEAVAESEELLARDGVDVVLVGTPPVTHAGLVVSALRAGKHVVCEKPFALHTADCDRMIALAASEERTLTVYQNRRWDPDFVALRQLVRAGELGDVFHMEAFTGSYQHPCGYWHSHEPISGGAIFDWGSHHIDWILQLLDGPVRSVRARAHDLIWHDVTNADHVTVEIDFASGAQAFFIHSELAAAPKPKWYVLGTRAAAVGDWQSARIHTRGPDGELDEERVLPTDLPARLRVLRPDGEGGTHQETLSLPGRDRLAFWRNLEAHLRHGEALAVTATEARRTIAVMEAATQSARDGGALVELAV